MADTKLSALVALAGANIAVADLLAVVDVSDTTMAATGTTKKSTVTDLIAALQRLGDLPEVVHKTADQSSSDATVLADVTGMGFPVAANGIYVVEYHIFTVSAAITTGLVLALNGPAIGTGYVRYGAEFPTSATAAFQAGATAYEQAMVATGTISTTVPSLVQLSGYLANGATAGTLALRMRSEVAASNATIQRGSWGRLTRLA